VRTNANGGRTVDPRRDLLELSILYDTARGFLGLRQRVEVLDTALLSLMGACAARFAIYLERDGDDGLRPQAAQGLEELPEDALRLTARAAGRIDGADYPLAGERLDALGTRFAAAARRLGVEVLAPLHRPGPRRSVLALGPKLLGEPYGERDLAVVREIAGQASLALGPARREVDSSAHLVALRRKYPALERIHGNSASTALLFRELVGLSRFDLPVLVLGETGTGKELVARAIHDLSHRSEGAFEAINCAAIPRDLMASALFGHEKGAFTGADATVPGAFERAGEGTLFLDEIGDMPLDTQAMLLRVLEERSFRRVGGTSVIPARARVISATNRNLLREVEESRFRRDLFYRLQMYTVRIRPLRERAEEIPVLATHVFEALRAEGKADVTASPAFLDALQARTLWGNVRELESLIAGAIVRAGGSGELRVEHLPPEAAEEAEATADDAPGDAAPRAVRALPRPGESRGIAAAAPAPAAQPVPRRRAAERVPSYANMEREYIRSVLELTGGNRREAARLMGIPRTTLTSKIKRFGLAPGADGAP
jgi:DNA-binding NtrC family response regulator